MADDSDVDSWYDWKGGANWTGMSRGKDSSRLDHFISDDSEGGITRINGLPCRHPMPSSSRSGSEVRFINPAIYAESLDKDEGEHEIKIRVKVDSRVDREDRRCNGQIEANCGDSTDTSDLLSTLSIKNDLNKSLVDHGGDQESAQETYRCYSLISPNTTSSLESVIVRSESVVSSKPTARVERRCRIADESDMINKGDPCSARQNEPEVQRYSLNGQRVVQVSTTSFSSTSISESRMNGVDLARKMAHDEWIRKKQQAAQRKKDIEELLERKKKMDAEKLAREKEERESRERENFLRWTERKKREEERKKAAVDRELELQKRLKEIEDKTAVAKALYLRQWARKKKEGEKARQKEEEMKQKQIEEERRKRLHDSTIAYEKWKEMSKNKPKPATQGLLPHQKAKPAYINPTPWQPIVNDSDDVHDDETDSKKVESRMKISSRKNAPSYQ